MSRGPRNTLPSPNNLARPASPPNATPRPAPRARPSPRPAHPLLQPARVPRRPPPRQAHHLPPLPLPPRAAPAPQHALLPVLRPRLGADGRRRLGPSPRRRLPARRWTHPQRGLVAVGSGGRRVPRVPLLPRALAHPRARAGRQPAPGRYRGARWAPGMAWCSWRCRGWWGVGVGLPGLGMAGWVLLRFILPERLDVEGDVLRVRVERNLWRRSDARLRRSEIDRRWW